MSGSESTKDPSYQIPERSRSSLTNHRNLAYNILKYLEDEMVRDKEISDLGPCSECTNDILTLPLKAYTVLSCGHLFHRFCIEKKLMITRPDVCPFPDCRKKVDAIYPVPTSTRRDSQSSQSSGTSALSTFMGEKFNLISPIPEDPMEEVEDTSNQETEKRLFCAKCSEEITVDFPKDTVFLSCKHAVHYDCIDNPHKRCPTCTSADDVEMISVEQTSSTAQKRSNDLPEKSSSKKKKTTNKDDVSTMLKRLIEELLTNIPDSGEEEANAPDVSSNTGKFLYLSDMIDQAETKNEDATRNVINRYFDFGEALYLRYKELKPRGGKDGAKALVKEEVRKQIPGTKFSDDALRKRMERAGKVYKLFNSIGRTKIARIRSFPARSILNLSDSNVDRVLAGVLRAERS